MNNDNLGSMIFILVVTLLMGASNVLTAINFSKYSKKYLAVVVIVNILFCSAIVYCK